MLLFKRQFLPAIRDGLKTQTIRCWKQRRVKPGQRSYIPGVGPIQITAVEPIQLDELTDADAQPDGFENADALRREITRLYPDPDSRGFQAYRVVFELLPRP